MADAVDNFEWDDDKAAANLEKHGLAFDLISDLDWERAFTAEDLRFDYRETRFVTIGPINDRLCVAVWTWRGDACRIISLRKANSREEKLYGEKIED
ncbi:MAG: BrnT family toxin [Pseudomonadota bacterium]